MEMYTYPITVEREGRKYWAYSEDFPGEQASRKVTRVNRHHKHRPVRMNENSVRAANG